MLTGGTGRVTACDPGSQGYFVEAVVTGGYGGGFRFDRFHGDGADRGFRDGITDQGIDYEFG